MKIAIALLHIAICNNKVASHFKIIEYSLQLLGTFKSIEMVSTSLVP